jgi:glycosyltransferase involved in cell wall biosynthesis
MPPVRSGIAACSADLVRALGAEHHIDLFVDEPVVALAPGTRSAHEFLWRHHLAPYDLTVFQLGNSSHHDFAWPYLFRFPGLVVLHDAHLHHARAAALLRRGETTSYRAEFAANHPDQPRELAELAVAGFDSQLYYSSPMTRLIAQTARRVAVHTQAAADALLEAEPTARVEVVRLGHGERLAEPDRLEARARGRARLGVAADDFLFGCFGGLAPEKRLPQILTAFAATLASTPSARLLLAGEAASHFDLKGEIKQRGIASRTIVTGYVESEARLTEYIAASDATLNLRWPTAGEISGPWLRCLALGLPTVIVDLAHLADVPGLDPRTWQTHGGVSAAPVCIAVDILDEDHSLALAMRRLAAQPSLRARLGQAAADYWSREHAVELMVEDYRALLGRALLAPAPTAALPAHLRDDGRGVLDGIGRRFGLAPILR